MLEKTGAVGDSQTGSQQLLASALQVPVSRAINERTRTEVMAELQSHIPEVRQDQRTLMICYAVNQ